MKNRSFPSIPRNLGSSKEGEKKKRRNYRGIRRTKRKGLVAWARRAEPCQWFHCRDVALSPFCRLVLRAFLGCCRRSRCRVDVAAPLLTRRCDLYSVTARPDALRAGPRPTPSSIRQRRPAATGYEHVGITTGDSIERPWTDRHSPTDAYLLRDLAPLTPSRNYSCEYIHIHIYVYSRGMSWRPSFLKCWWMSSVVTQKFYICRIILNPWITLSYVKRNIDRQSSSRCQNFFAKYLSQDIVDDKRIWKVFVSWKKMLIILGDRNLSSATSFCSK